MSTDENCKTPSQCTVQIWKAIAARDPRAIAQMIASMREQGGCVGMSDADVEEVIVLRAARKLAS